jgi:Zn-dependent M28 family amino/carboxypeptidase
MMDPSIPGEEDLLMIFYSGQCPELADIADKSNKSIDLDLMLEPVLTFHSSSDHVPFHQSEIPSLFLFTGFHNDYHTPRDTPDKIIFSKLARVVELAYKISYNIAEVRERPRFDHSITEVERKGRYGE